MGKVILEPIRRPWYRHFVGGPQEVLRDSRKAARGGGTLNVLTGTSGTSEFTGANSGIKTGAKTAVPEPSAAAVTHDQKSFHFPTVCPLH
jgi:hypothetical protein